MTCGGACQVVEIEMVRRCANSVEDRGVLPPVECPSFRSDDSDLDEARKVYRPVFAQPITVWAPLTVTNGLHTLEQLISRLPPTKVLGLQESASVVRSIGLQ